MKQKLSLAVFLLLAFGLLTLSSCSEKPPQNNLDYNTFCFYYNWYGNKKTDGKDYHWSHAVLRSGPSDTTTAVIPGGDNISTNFFPELGPYSSTDSTTVALHMDMLAEARIGVLVLTWWNVNDFGYQSVPLIMDEAAKVGIKVIFHIEPFRGRTAQTTKDNIKEIIDKYGKHPAFYYTKEGKPMFFIYDSYTINVDEWATLLTPEGEISMRNTPYDAVMIGLWVKAGEEAFFEKSGFDGFYTYFGATNFTYGSSPANWPYLQQWAAEHGKLFIPSVGPGYIDARVRPWNTPTIRDRENGKYYDNMYKAAIESKAEIIAITSFNEWHEGTQIEPAIPYEIPEFKYMDYSPLEPDYYLKRTAYWVGQFEKARKGEPIE